VSRRRALSATATLALGGLCVAYIVWKIDFRRTATALGDARPLPLVAAVAIWFAGVLPLAWRWQRLLRARDVHRPFGWLVRTYFVSYAAGQLLPTSLGGDAARIYSGVRRHGATEAFVGSVLMERILGGVATLLLAAVGLALAVGSMPIGVYIWIEAALLAATVVGAIVLFSRSARRPLARIAPIARALRLERPTLVLYRGLHAYRQHPRLVVAMTALSLFVQAVRVLAIWLLGRSVGVDLSPRAYYVMGPMLFLVMLVPFTVSGLAVREAFFVNFLGQLGIQADPAFATGLLFFLLSVVVSLPGVVIVIVERLRPPPLLRSSTPSAE
jgi:uncharacterized protein (TIRG00374 family)